MLIVKNLCKCYGARRAVSDVSFTIEKDEIVGFLGINGAGKSTTLKMISGVVEPDGGEIEICGINARSSVLQAKAHVGYLAENNPLYLDMYVREFLIFVHQVFNKSNAYLDVEAIIDRVGLREEACKKIRELSKGYKQRVGLAQALIHQPKILILDEPTTGLDPNQIIEIRSLIKKESKGRVVLFSSHILQEIESVCSRVIILDKGTIVSDLTVEELRRATNQKFVLEIDLSFPIEILEFQQLEGVDYCEFNPEMNFYRLYVSGDIRESIFEFCRSKNISINNFLFRTSTLEDLFFQLTHTTQ